MRMDRMDVCLHGSERVGGGGVLVQDNDAKRSAIWLLRLPFSSVEKLVDEMH